MEYVDEVASEFIARHPQPVYSILLPLFCEVTVLPGLVQHLSSPEYPA